LGTVTEDRLEGLSRTHRIAKYYRETFAQHGATPQGVDWKSEEAQQVRFRQLAIVLPAEGPFSVLDFGCGYGAFLPFLRTRWPGAGYAGLDVVPEMIAMASAKYSHVEDAQFMLAGDDAPAADYAVFNGIFHIMQDEQVPAWETYAKETLHRVWETTSRGMAFNVLSTYSDAERRRPHLYYGSPEEWFGWCVATFGRHVSLLHDYGLHEFTLLVRRTPDG
jgi:cyclopropane fatty-acyl-phospholipid synthase-like methyltransferase